MKETTNNYIKTGYDGATDYIINKIYSAAKDLPDDDKNNKQTILNLLRTEFGDDIADFGDHYPTAYELKHCLLDTLDYKNYSISILYDKLTQVIYFYFNGMCQACPSTVPNYYDYIRTFIDEHSLN